MQLYIHRVKDETRLCGRDALTTDFFRKQDRCGWLQAFDVSDVDTFCGITTRADENNPCLSSTYTHFAITFCICVYELLSRTVMSDSHM